MRVHTRRKIKYHIYSQALNKNAMQGLINVLFLQNHPTAAAKSSFLQRSRAKFCSRLHPGAPAGWLVQAKPVFTAARSRAEQTTSPEVHQIPFPSRGCVLFLAQQQQRETTKASHCSRQMAIPSPPFSRAAW